MKNLFLLYHVLCRVTKPLLVGGCVRDMLIGVKPKDFDIVIPHDFEQEQLISILVNTGFSVKEAGLRFLVIHAAKDGENFEIAYFRNDGKYVNGKPESVSPGCIETDANRRDFTINSVYFDWQESRYGDKLPRINEGVLIDPTKQGVSDIQSRTLRFVGRAKDRISEDPMRVFRFYRFCSKGFTPTPKTLRIVREQFNDCFSRLNGSGREAVREELEKAMLKGI